MESGHWMAQAFDIASFNVAHPLFSNSFSCSKSTVSTCLGHFPFRLMSVCDLFSYFMQTFNVLFLFGSVKYVVAFDLEKPQSYRIMFEMYFYSKNKEKQIFIQNCLLWSLVCFTFISGLILALIFFNNFKDWLKVTLETKNLIYFILICQIPRKIEVYFKPGYKNEN